MPINIAMLIGIFVCRFYNKIRPTPKFTRQPLWCIFTPNAHQSMRRQLWQDKVLR